jgi:DNA-binding XRE family transcriptional regulator
MNRDKMLTKEQKEQACNLAAANLRAMRAHLGWSQMKLANYTGTTRRRISEIENGQTKLTWTLFLALVALFAINPHAKSSPTYSAVIEDDVIRTLSDGNCSREDFLRMIGEDEQEKKRSSIL